MPVFRPFSITLVLQEASKHYGSYNFFIFLNGSLFAFRFPILYSSSNLTSDVRRDASLERYRHPDTPNNNLRKRLKYLSRAWKCYVHWNVANMNLKGPQFPYYSRLKFRDILSFDWLETNRIQFLDWNFPLLTLCITGTRQSTKTSIIRSMAYSFKRLGTPVLVLEIAC